MRWALLALIVLGALLRFYRLGNQSFWVDEILTLNAAEVGGWLTPAAVFQNIQGPIHALVVHFLARISTGEALLRSISAVFGVASIPVVYLLGAELSDRKTGLVAALLVALSPFCVWYSQEVRNYSMLIFFSALSTLLAWRIVMRGGRAWVGYVASVVLALFSNLGAVFLVVAYNVFAARRVFGDGRFARRWIVAHVVILLLFSPVIFLGILHWAEVDRVGERVVLAPLADEEELLRGETTFTPFALPYAVYAMDYGYSLGPSMKELHTEDPLAAFLRYAWLVLPAGVVYAGAQLWGLKSTWLRAPVRNLMLAVVLIPAAGATFLAVLNIKPFNPRYVSVMLPVLIVLAALGVTSLRRKVAVLHCALIALFCLLSLANYFYRPAYWREDVRGAAAYIEAHEEPGDLVLVPVVRRVFEFYFDGSAEVFVMHPHEARTDESVAGRIRERAAGYDRIWLVDARLWYTDPEGRIPAYLRSRYRLLDTASFPGNVVSLFDLRDALRPAERFASEGACAVRAGPGRGVHRDLGAGPRTAERPQPTGRNADGVQDGV